MSWESYEDFKNAAKVHFGFSLLLMIFFGVGYHHSRNTDFSAEGTAPYWVFGAVGGALVSSLFYLLALFRRNGLMTNVNDLFSPRKAWYFIQMLL